MTTTSRLSWGLGTPRRRGEDRHGGSGAGPPVVSVMVNIVLDENIVL
jgi:hypothetical protein